MMSHEKIESLVRIITTDEKLFSYITTKILQRLPNKARSDPRWCFKVIDYTIDECLNDINIVNILQLPKGEIHDNVNKLSNQHLRSLSSQPNVASESSPTNSKLADRLNH